MTTTGYYLDLGIFSLTKLKNLFKTTRLLPSQQILLEKMDEKFTCLEENGIENLEQLQKALKSKSAIQSFSKATGLPIDYLTVLRREVNSYQPKPIDLIDFPGIDTDVVHKLHQVGIKNTEQLFPYVLTRQARSEFAEQKQIEYEDILELTKLTDVARIKWVGPKFARLLIESEYDTVEKIADSNYQELHLALIQVNEKTGIYKGKFGIEDMKSWVNIVVQEVPQVIQY
ncbi:MAG: DUF4332 domain-containing protein [Anaerolineaceae bacterium]|nr:DUF4332 domain-containing protein [Anaerolineaceae bacterium]